jgi:hypothetical protein
MSSIRFSGVFLYDHHGKSVLCCSDSCFLQDLDFVTLYPYSFGSAVIYSWA